MHQMEKETYQAILVSNDQLFKRGVITRSDFQH
jgi:histidinol phosphatase-like enzyme